MDLADSVFLYGLAGVLVGFFFMLTISKGL